MEIRQEPIPSGALKFLQIRAIAFRDTVEKLVATFDDNVSGGCTPEDGLTSVTVLLDEMADIEGLHVSASIPEWFGPAEQLSLQVANSGELLLKYADQLLSHIESHDKDAHAYGCRCYEFQDLLVERIGPTFAEWKDLQEAIERLRQHQCSQNHTKDSRQ